MGTYFFRFLCLPLHAEKTSKNMSMNQVTQDCLESAYCFFHQKLRVYEFSNNPSQRDDIEYAISQYVDGMNRQLYLLLANGKEHYLLEHSTFEEDMKDALRKLEEMM